MRRLTFAGGRRLSLTPLLRTYVVFLVNDCLDISSVTAAVGLPKTCRIGCLLCRSLPKRGEATLSEPSRRLDVTLVILRSMNLLERDGVQRSMACGSCSLGWDLDCEQS